MNIEEASNSPFGSEPSAEVKYLSDGTGRQPDIIGVERQEISTVGKRFLKASGGDACLVVVGPLVSQWEVGGQSTESAIIRCCLGRFGYPDTPFPGTIDLVLDTLGGSLDTAFKAVLFISRFTERLRVFVPRRAKSSGTLIAIGANELYLSPFGELGPLDTQIRDPRNPANKVSALDCYQSVDYVRTFGLSTLSQAFKTLATETRVLIPLSHLMDTSANFSIGTIAPILTQVNSLDFGGWGRTLRIGEMYAQALLSRIGYDKDDAAGIAYQLVYGYTHHPFPIDIKEATDLGLRPRLMAEDQYKNAHEIVRRCVKPGTVVVGFTDEPPAQPSARAPQPSPEHSENQATNGGVPPGRLSHFPWMTRRHRLSVENVMGNTKQGPVADIEEGETVRDESSSYGDTRPPLSGSDWGNDR